MGLFDLDPQGLQDQYDPWGREASVSSPVQAPASNNWMNIPGSPGYQVDSNAVNTLLSKYGVRATGHISPFENLPDIPFWANHSKIGAGLNAAISAAAFAEPSRTAGEGIGVAGRMIAGSMQRNRDFKSMQLLAPFKVAEANAQLQQADDEHHLREAQSEIYKSHGAYWMGMQKNHFGSQPFADSEGYGQTIDERTGNVQPLVDGQGNKIRLSNKFTMGAQTDKTLTERLATMAEQAEADQNGIQFTGPGSIWGLQKRGSWIKNYDANMAGLKGGASATGRNAANASDPNQLTDVDKEQVKGINKQYDEQTLNKNNTANRKQIRRELRRGSGTTPSEEQIDSVIDQKNAEVEKQRNGAIGAYLSGRKPGNPAPNAPRIRDFTHIGKK